MQCVESLANNPESKDSILYIISDAPFMPAHGAKIQEVRRYISQIKGFKQIVGVCRETNLGSYLSTKEAIDKVVAKHGRAIFLEDDNIVAPCFLNFINSGLTFYEDDRSVFSISGYNYPVQMPQDYPHDVYKWWGFSAWGVGLWRERWETIQWGYEPFREIIKSADFVRAIHKLKPGWCLRIAPYAEKELKIVDLIISCNMWLSRQHTVFPVLSKVRNMGHDGRGEHCGVTGRYSNQEMDNGGEYCFVRGLAPDRRINMILKEHFAISAKDRILLKLSQKVPLLVKGILKRVLSVER
jgi:hypothetical protein